MRPSKTFSHHEDRKREEKRKDYKQTENNSNRFIVIDGANIGHLLVPGQENSRQFHAFRLEQAVNACNKKGFSVIILLPQHYIESQYKKIPIEDVNYLLNLEKAGLLSRLPSYINDDRPIIDLAKAKNGYILSNDHFKDHIQSGFLPTKFRAERLFKCYALKNELVLIEPDQYKVPMLHSLTQLRVSKHNGQPKQVIQDTKSEESVYNKETTSTDNSTDRYLQCNSCKSSIPRGKYLGDESKFQCYECRPKLKCTMCKILTPKGKYEGEPGNFACYKCRTGGPNEKTSVIIPKAKITTVSNHENIDSLPIAVKVTRITTASNHENIDSLPIAAEVKSQEDNKELLLRRELVETRIQLTEYGKTLTNDTSMITSAVNFICKEAIPAIHEKTKKMGQNDVIRVLKRAMHLKVLKMQAESERPLHLKVLRESEYSADTSSKYPSTSPKSGGSRSSNLDSSECQFLHRSRSQSKSSFPNFGLQSRLVDPAVNVGKCWSCRACTLLNQPHLDACVLCGTPRY